MGAQQLRHQPCASPMHLAGELCMRVLRVCLSELCLSMQLLARRHHAAHSLSPHFYTTHTDTFLSALHSLTTVSNFE